MEGGGFLKSFRLDSSGFFSGFLSRFLSGLFSGFLSGFY